MYSSQYIILFISISTAVNAAEPKQESSISCKIKAFDEDLLKITGYLNDARYSYPSNDAEFNQYCKNVKSGAKYAKSFALKCLAGRPSKSVISVFAFATNQANKKVCSSRGKFRENLVKHIRCLHSNSEPNKKCFDDYLERLNVTAKIEPPNDKIPFICCITETMKQCVLETLRKSNEPTCTEDFIQEYQQFFEVTQGNLFNLACENFEDTEDRCQTKINQKLKPFKKPLPKSPWKTPFPILIDIFDSL